MVMKGFLSLFLSISLSCLSPYQLRALLVRPLILPENSVRPRWHPALLTRVVVVRECVVLVRGGKVQRALLETDKRLETY